MGTDGEGHEEAVTDGEGSSSGSSGSKEDSERVCPAREDIERGGKDAERIHVGMTATVVKGFGRGSKLLGIPTANMCMQDIGHAADRLSTGIYFGYAVIGPRPEVYPAVVSIGWNPYFENREKTVEPHLLHTFEDDFYGEKLCLLIAGYIRPEMNFRCLDDLICAIQDDIEYAKQRLAEPEFAVMKTIEEVEKACTTTPPSQT